MQRAALVCFAISLIFPLVSSAELVTIPLPELEGIYSQITPSVRRVEVPIERVPTSLSSVRLHLQGSVAGGALACSGFPTMPDLVIWPMDFAAFIYDPLNESYWHAGELTPETGDPGNIYEFEFTDSFRSLFNASWDFFVGSTHTLELEFHGIPSAFIAICSVVDFPSGSVTRAELILEGDFPLAAEPTTWGRIKSLYGS